MARFGQGMIQALTQPSYMQGLYEAAKGIGQIPQRNELNRMLTGLQPGTAEYSRALAEFYAKKGGEENARRAADLGAQATQLGRAGVVSEAEQQIADIRLRIQDTAKDFSIPEEDRNAAVAGYQREINQIARDANLPASNYNYSQDALIGAEQARERKVRFEAFTANQEFTEEQQEHARKVWSEWDNNAEVRALVSDTEAFTARYQRIYTAAKGGMTAEQYEQIDPEGAEKFPGYKSIFEAVKVEREEAQANLEAARLLRDERKNDTVFRYTDQELIDLGFSPENIEQIKAIGKTDPKRANNMIPGMIANAAQNVGELPAVGYLNVLEEAALGAVVEAEGFRLTSTSQRQAAESLAATVALEAANVFSKTTGTPATRLEAAVNYILAYQSEEEKRSATRDDAAERNRQLRERLDAAAERLNN